MAVRSGTLAHSTDDDLEVPERDATRRFPVVVDCAHVRRAICPIGFVDREVVNQRAVLLEMRRRHTYESDPRARRPHANYLRHDDASLQVAIRAIRRLPAVRNGQKCIYFRSCLSSALSPPDS